MKEHLCNEKFSQGKCQEFVPIKDAFDKLAKESWQESLLRDESGRMMRDMLSVYLEGMESSLPERVLLRPGLEFVISECAMSRQGQTVSEQTNQYSEWFANSGLILNALANNLRQNVV